METQEIMCVDEIPYYKKRNEKIEKKVSETGQWNELPEKYLTKVGERGVRLSGGQLQRIGIARALYNDPKVLILDEATSSLDYETEKVLIDAINKLGKHITIIIIAHRLNTVKRCDKILVLEKGKIKDQGTFEKLFKTNENFFKNVSNK